VFIPYLQRAMLPASGILVNVIERIVMAFAVTLRERLAVTDWEAVGVVVAAALPVKGVPSHAIVFGTFPGPS
jgi:hypothetical protein